MDNLVMIQAGDLIDNSIGVTFGLSTLTAAGFGQCFSDVAGNLSGGTVDAAVSKLNIPRHGLGQAQLGLKSARVAHTLGGCVGVVLGCLLGMTSLLFMVGPKSLSVSSSIGLFIICTLFIMYSLIPLRLLVLYQNGVNNIKCILKIIVFLLIN